ncbi:MAG: hypothetical protein RSB48_08485, partial [Akkermansia sp.]
GIFTFSHKFCSSDAGVLENSQLTRGMLGEDKLASRDMALDDRLEPMKIKGNIVRIFIEE